MVSRKARGVAVTTVILEASHRDEQKERTGGESSPDSCGCVQNSNVQWAGTGLILMCLSSPSDGASRFFM